MPKKQIFAFVIMAFNYPDDQENTFPIFLVENAIGGFYWSNEAYEAMKFASEKEAVKYLPKAKKAGGELNEYMPFTLQIIKIWK